MRGCVALLMTTGEADDGTPTPILFAEQQALKGFE